jgi:hypothetical protein
MFPFKHWKTILWVLAALLALYIIGNFYALFFRPATIQGNNSIVPILITGLLLGGTLMYILLRMNARGKKQIIESSHTVVESVRKVFKIVCAEGQFNELYNYEETKKLLGILPSTNKALVIIKAKVLVGFNFEKMKWEVDEINKKIKLIEFPEAEILSIETDYKYYNMEENILTCLAVMIYQKSSKMVKSKWKLQRSIVIYLKWRQNKCVLFSPKYYNPINGRLKTVIKSLL